MTRTWFFAMVVDWVKADQKASLQSIVKKKKYCKMRNNWRNPAYRGKSVVSQKDSFVNLIKNSKQGQNKH